MIKIEGLDKLTRDLGEAQKAIQELDGELGAVNFNPEDPESIEKAITAMEQMVDQRVGRYASNPIVGPLIDQMKESYRQAILDKAAASRLGGDAV
jgi:hypothetical protein